MSKEGLKVELAKFKCEDDHLYFSRYFFKARQGIKFRVNWHHRLIADTIERVISGEIKNLVINVPPGSSKTEMVVINLIARGLALNPRARFLHLSGSDSLASLNSATAREIIKSDEYQKLWPLQIADDAKAKKRWNVLVNGQPAGGVYATSLGGQVTGFRAGHMTPGFQGCFVGDTLIQTKQGLRRIDEISTGTLVLSFNHRVGELQWKKVIATKVSARSDIFETICVSGKRIKSTPCHRFYDGKSYRPISEFNPRETLYSVSRDALVAMQSMHEDFSTTTRRYRKGHKLGFSNNVLFLFLFSSTCESDRTFASFREYFMSNLQEGFQAVVEAYQALLFRLFKSIPLASYARGGEFQLSEAGRVPNSVQENETANSRARWWLFDLFSKRSSSHPSYGREHLQQSSAKLSDSVQNLSYCSSQIETQCISSITEITSPETKVYDIQVEGNHNFFAEGILVHNCLIIDDPIKPEDAFSKVKLDSANRALVTTVKSRKANPDTPIIIIMQRIAENDPVGFIKGGNLGTDWTYVKIPALIDDAYFMSLDEKYKKMIEPSEKDVGGRFSYWPYKEPLQVLLAMERGDGSDQSGSRISRHVFSSQYNQDPVSVGGNIIKGEHFIKYTVLPKIKFRKLYADTAQKTKERNDFSVFEEWGYGVDGKAYLLDLIRGKWEAPELQKRASIFWNKASARESEKFGQLREMKVEDKSSGTGLIQTLKLPPYNIPVKPIERFTDKLTRAMDALPYIEAGLVCVPEDAPFTNDFIAECEAFTADDTHAYDDQVDPLLDMVQDMLSAGNKIKIWEALAKQN